MSAFQVAFELIRSATNDAVADALLANLLKEHEEEMAKTTEPECPYTHAHTRHWCGYDTCRDE